MIRPSGWDNEKKISILYDNIQSFSPDDDYNDVIMAPHNVNVSYAKIWSFKYFIFIQNDAPFLYFRSPERFDETF